MPSTELQEFFDEIRDLPEFVSLGEEFAGACTRGLFGDTPLHEAVGQGHIEAVRLLLSRGADAGIRNDWGQTARESAQIGGKHEIESLFDVV
jgi:uncharacterized protein